MEYIYPLLLGPFAQPRWKDIFIRLFLVALLTPFTLVGGILIWPALCISTDNIGWYYQAQRIFLPFFCYLIGTWWLVPLLARPFNTVPLPCSLDKEYPIVTRSYLTCLSNRNYVAKPVRDELLQISKVFSRVEPKGTMYYMDTGFPIPMIPAFPNTSHRGGKTVALSFIWKDQAKIIPPPSPIGYGNDYGWVQTIFSNGEIHKAKSKKLLAFMAQNEHVKNIIIDKDLELTKANPERNKIIDGSASDFFTLVFH